MAIAPTLQQRDGSGYAQEIAFSTNQATAVLTGKIDVRSVDVQVSINGSAFVSDPTLVSLNEQAFTVPNLASYPDGLTLDLGLNTIQIRAIDMVGGVSAPATAYITRVQTTFDAFNLIPSGIRVRRSRDTVTILATTPQTVLTSKGVPTTTLAFKGFNFYASTAAAGTTGYFRINAAPVTSKISYGEDVLSIGTNTVQWVGAQKIVRVRITEEDEFHQNEVTRLNTTYDARTYFDGLRFTSSLDSVTSLQYIGFDHSRRNPGVDVINSDLFVQVADSDPLYYVVTAVYYDPTTQQEVESAYSQEVLGLPLVIDTAIRDLPMRSQLQVVTDFINAVQRVDKDISLIPGSSTREVRIDPFASEIERVWFLVDFVHRSQSVLTLLQVDDANSDGISDDVASSAYKQALKSALGFTTDAAVQNLIDTQFDKLAGNVQLSRLPGRPAIGQVVGYVLTRPSADIPIPSGTIVSTDSDATTGQSAVQYRVGGTYTMYAANADAYYNFGQKRYEITLDIVAESIGSNGNRSAGQIHNIQGVPGLKVTNDDATLFGTDRESNADLAARVLLAYPSVDTGTEGGYSLTVANQGGIIKSKIVKAGDPLMMRDWDPVRVKHIGGKVDVWIEGLRERQVTDRFAFTYDIARDVRCQVLDATLLRFRVLDSRVTPDTPIVEVLNNPLQGLGVRNATLGEDYNLSGLVIEDWQTFRLNSTISQPVTTVDDIVIADYRFRSVNKFVFSLQPVRRIVSVSGEISGALTPDVGYKLYKTEDPLLEGESTIAGDYLSIKQVGGVPSGASIGVNDEQHVMVGFEAEPLLSVGINTRTIRVFSQDRSVEYHDPESAVPDYEVIEGTQTTPPSIVRTASAGIPNGATVSVDYSHDENMTVTYVINDLLQQLQRVLNRQRHVTADVLAKQAISNGVYLETTVQMSTGAVKETVDPLIRSAVSQEMNRRGIGHGIAQSDLIHATDATAGVDYQIVPLARMGYVDGSRKIRESVASSFRRVSSLDLGGQQAFLLTSALQYPTTDGGGLETEHKGVFQDDIGLTLSATLASVASSANQGYIIGSGGAVIMGWSDDATLEAEGFLNADDREAERLRRTANHVVVALSALGTIPEDPESHVYAVTYVVRGDTGPHDIKGADVEYLDLSGLTITYRKG